MAKPRGLRPPMVAGMGPRLMSPKEFEMRMFPKSEPISKTIVAVALLMMIGIPAGMLVVFAIRVVGAMLG